MLRPEKTVRTGRDPGIDRESFYLDGAWDRRTAPLPQPILHPERGAPFQPTRIELDRIADGRNSLIVTCNDGAHGFRTAADETKAIELKEIFIRSSRQHDEFPEALRTTSGTSDANPGVGALFTSKRHRGWINLQSAFSRNGAHVVTKEVPAGETARLPRSRISQRLIEGATGDPRRPKFRSRREQPVLPAGAW